MSTPRLCRELTVGRSWQKQLQEARVRKEKVIGVHYFYPHSQPWTKSFDLVPSTCPHRVAPGTNAAPPAAPETRFQHFTSQPSVC